VKITFRLEGDELWACDDEGRSRCLSDAQAATLLKWWEESALRRPKDGRTAAVLADLGQARMARPHPTGRTVPAQTNLQGERISLSPMTIAESASLVTVLKRRRSSRIFGPATAAQLATLLMRAGRVRDLTTVEDGYQASHRPTPSAGARHPFDLHVAVGTQVNGLVAGIYVFDGVAGALVAQDQTDAEAGALLARLRDHLGAPALPAAAIFLMGYLDRTLSRYPAGMSLVWRDAGALLQALHLCATDLDLRSCIAGTCGLLRDEDRGPVIDMGCLAVGGRPY
jgi:SagB-type dehydrogenase family enzyme